MSEVPGSKPSPQAKSEPRATLQPKRSWLMGCLMTVLIAGCALAIIGAIWSWRAEQQSRRFCARVADMLDEFRQSHPRPSEEANSAPHYKSALALLAQTKPPYRLCIEEALSDTATDYTCVEVEAYLANSAPAVHALNAAMKFPECDFGDLPSSIHRWEGADALKAGIVRMAVSARHSAQLGRPREALADIASIVRMSSDLNRNHASLTTRSHANECLRASLQGVLNLSEPGTADAEAVLSRLDEYCVTRPPRAHDLEIYKLAMLADMREMNNDRALAARKIGGRSILNRMAVGLYFKTGLLSRDAAFMEAAIDRVKPILENDPAAVDQSICSDSAIPPKLLVGSYMMLYVEFASTMNAYVDSLPGADLTRLALGCRLYRLKFGAYPEALAGLSAKLPEHFRELPADPFTGKPFLYRRTETGCVVWSAGRNRADDGGDPKKDLVFELKR